MTKDDKLARRLREEASTAAEKLRQDPGVLAVILTGPLALGKASESDKLYFAVITDREDGVIEHHFLDDGLEETTRPIEMGRFPLAVARYLLEHGYTDIVSYKSLEAFRCGLVLWEREGVGTEMVRGAERHIPEKTFVGESLHGAVSALDDAVALLRSGDHKNSVVVAREAAVKAVAMMIGGKAARGGTSFLEAARQALPPERFEAWLEIMGLGDVNDDSAAASARGAREFAEHVLGEIGVDPRSVLGSPEKESPA